MTASRALGHHKQQSGERCEFLTLAFSPLNAPLRSRWRNNGLSADFLGDYVTTFLPTDRSTTGVEGSQTGIRHAVTHIANELLENAMKYHEHDVNIPIEIRLELTSDHITVSASNGIDAEQARCYQAFVENILHEDAGDLLVRRLEEGAGGKESKKSCIGLLTIMNDYVAQLGWHFESHPAYSDVMTVTTSALLSLKNFPGVCA
jgi:hypothetical protein